jgi:ribonuclease D
VGTPEIGDGAAARPDPVLLTEPFGGTPDVVTEPGMLAEVSAAIAAGQGPIAVDTERAKLKR